jgi:thymidylate kinase
VSGLILIEGPDGTGKSTLAAQFKQDLGAIVLHQRYRWKNRMFHYHTAVLRRALKLVDQGHLVVLDRLWPSELIYGQVYRGGSPIPLEGRFMDRVLLKHASLYIFCGGDPKVIAERHAKLKQQRDELYESHIEQLALAYDRFVKDFASVGDFWRFDVMKYSIEDDGAYPSDYVKRAATRLDLWRKRQFQPALSFSQQNVLGHAAWAKFLFVGDKCNQKHRGMLWPFYEYGNCSLFMTECLHDLGFREELGMWTNANAGAEFNALLEFRPHLKVIALGAEAHDALHAAGVKHEAVPHPQYGRRFDRDGFKRHLKLVLSPDELQDHARGVSGGAS